MALLRSFGRPDPARGAFVITASGGGATLTADAAERNGAVLAPLTADTVTTLRAELPAGPVPRQPARRHRRQRPGRRQGRSYDAVAADPTVGILVEPYVLPWPDESEGHRWHRDALERLADAAAETGVDVAVISTFEQEPNDWITGYASRRNVSVTCGLEDTMKALGKLYGVSGARPSGVGGPPRAGQRLGRAPARPRSPRSRGARSWRRAGFAVPRGGVASSEAEAVELAAALRQPLVVKVSEPAVAHKGRIGGVEIGVVGEDGVRDGLAPHRGERRGERHAGAERRRGAGRRDGVRPRAARRGAARRRRRPDADVAVGGWAAESGAVFGTTPLPASADDLAALRRALGPAAAAGRGARRRAGPLRRRSSGGRSWTATSAAYETVEINPLMLTADGAVAADVLLLR